jgi:hypothetical protein
MEKLTKNVEKKRFFRQPKKIARNIMSPLVSAISELQGIFLSKKKPCVVLCEIKL